MPGWRSKLPPLKLSTNNRGDIGPSLDTEISLGPNLGKITQTDKNKSRESVRNLTPPCRIKIKAHKFLTLLNIAQRYFRSLTLVFKQRKTY